MPPLTPLQKKVAAVVRGIPRGQVLSYGRVAALCGIEGGARAVVRALHALNDVPWWRVVRSDNTIAEQMFREQAPKLKREGVKLEGRKIAARPERSRRAKRAD